HRVPPSFPARRSADLGVLREHPAAGRWDVPLLLTLGSPLAVRAIRDVLAARAPLRVPAPVRRWVAVRDRRDALALHGLGPDAFRSEEHTSELQSRENL